MQKFEYRTPRFSVDIPVQFTVEGSALDGRCTEIGQEGMTLELKQPLTPNSSGMVSLTYRDQTLEIRARVAHATGTNAGLEFLYNSEEERSNVANLVASVASPPSRPGPVLLN